MEEQRQASERLFGDIMDFSTPAIARLVSRATARTGRGTST
jgi:hypothetical protein